MNISLKLLEENITYIVLCFAYVVDSLFRTSEILQNEHTGIWISTKNQTANKALLGTCLLQVTSVG
jgi:hypothetical protein